MDPADFFQRERTPVGVHCGMRAAVLQVFRHIGKIDELVDGGDGGAGNYVFEFAHIAAPAMLQQRGLRATR